MLKRISKIEGIGLLHDANGKQFSLRKANLVYGDNGAGKSTIALILRSLSRNSDSAVNNARTLGGTKVPMVELQFDGGKAVNLKSGIWSEPRPEILVFDADFVSSNVHSGGMVDTDHRKNLLEFALGTSAVAARKRVDKSSMDARTASDNIASISAQLLGHHSGISLSAFQALATIPDIDARITECEAQIAAASNIASILARPIPTPVLSPPIPLDNFAELLPVSIEGISEAAAEKVKAHLEALGKQNESWVAQGHKIFTGKACPFCDQAVEQSELISAYKSYFNAAYSDLKNRVGTSAQLVLSASSSDRAKEVASSFELASGKISAWNDLLKPTLVAYDAPAAAKELALAHESLQKLAARKISAPADPLQKDSLLDDARMALANYNAKVEHSNKQIAQARSEIEQFKKTLSGTNVSLLQSRLASLRATKRKEQPAVQALLTALTGAVVGGKHAEKEKQDARTALDIVMKATLGKYQASINALLAKFGASFSIVGFTANFRGSAPRSEYGLEMRVMTQHFLHRSGR